MKMAKYLTCLVFFVCWIIEQTTPHIYPNTKLGAWLHILLSYSGSGSALVKGQKIAQAFSACFYSLAPVIEFWED